MGHERAPKIAVSTSAQVAANDTRTSGPSPSTSRPALVQAKLSVGPAGDRYEQEADRVAAAVMQGIRRASSSGSEGFGAEGSDRVQPMQRGDRGEVGSDRDLLGTDDGAPAGRIQPMTMIRSSDAAEAQPRVTRIQAKTMSATIGAEGGSLDADTHSRIRRAAGSGQPLGDGLRRSMEGGFGADFSAVRVHADALADDLNQRVQARAFTTGSDIFFRQGEYQPASPAGQELLAHELTHVVQQGAAAAPAVQRVITVLSGEDSAPTKISFQKDDIRTNPAMGRHLKIGTLTLRTSLTEAKWKLLDADKVYESDVVDNTLTTKFEELNEVLESEERARAQLEAETNKRLIDRVYNVYRRIGWGSRRSIFKHCATGKPGDRSEMLGHLREDEVVSLIDANLKAPTAKMTLQKRTSRFDTIRSAIPNTKENIVFDIEFNRRDEAIKMTVYHCGPGEGGGF